MNDQQRDQQTETEDQPSAAQHALDDQSREENSFGTTAPTKDQAYHHDDGSALGSPNADPVSEASAESFPASDPSAWTADRD